MSRVHGDSQRSERVNRFLSRVTAIIEAEYVDRSLRALQRLLRLSLDPRARFHARVLEAECYLAQERLLTAQDLLESVRTEAPSSDDLLRVDLLIAHCLAKSGKALEALQQVVSVLRHPDLPPELKARGRWVAGFALYRRGHYSWARDCFQYAAAHYRILNWRTPLAQVLTNLALVAKSEGRIDASLSYLDEAVRLVPNKGYLTTRLHLLINRGLCLYKLGQVENARTCFLDAQRLAESTKNHFVMTAVQNNLGHIYRIQGKHAIAEEYYREALGSARSQGAARKECLALEFLGECLAEDGRLAEGLANLNLAYDLAKKLAGHGDLMMEVLRRRGEIHAAMGNHESASDDLQRAIGMCRSRGEKREQVLAQRAYSLLSTESVTDLSVAMQKVLEDLEALGDRFEYARTVYLLLTDGRVTCDEHPWLAEASAAATHYFNCLGSRLWKQRLQAVVGHARNVKQTNREPPLAPASRLTTRSSQYARMLDSARLAARSSHPALILGETGSGKEVVARLIHEWSSRAAGPMVGVNCGALTESLAESELFGHVKGAFTGAERDKTGLFEAAQGGTVLLDEVGDLPAHTQVKLLRFFDTNEIRRVGETQVRRVDVRVLAATNKSVTELVSEGRFRQDLYYRLNVFRIEVPPLRERREDILLLAHRFLQEESQSEIPIRISQELENWLESWDWPGNVRELRNLCRYLTAHAWGKPEIAMADLPTELRSASVSPGRIHSVSAFEREKQDLKRAQVFKALREANGSISGAASLLGMSRNTVTRLLRQYGVRRESFRG